MLTKRTNRILVGMAALAVIAVAIYFLFFAGAGYVEGRPTFKYFRLET